MTLPVKQELSPITQVNMIELALFTGQSQFGNFCRFKGILPVSRMAASSTPRPIDPRQPGSVAALRSAPEGPLLLRRSDR